MEKRLLSSIDQMRKIRRFSFKAICFQMTIMIHYTANGTFVKAVEIKESQSSLTGLWWSIPDSNR